MRMCGDECGPVRKAGISIIVAYDKNRVIGCDGRLPWRIRGEQLRFRALTMGNVVVMGRRTWEEIGRPLPGRTTVVLSRSWTRSGAAGPENEAGTAGTPKQEYRSGTAGTPKLEDRLEAACIPRSDGSLEIVGKPEPETGSETVGKPEPETEAGTAGIPEPETGSEATGTPEPENGPGIVTAGSLAQVLQAFPDREIFVAGGAKLSQEALSLADRLYITQIDADTAAGVEENRLTCFPPLPDPEVWSVEEGEWISAQAEFPGTGKRETVRYRYLTFVRDGINEKHHEEERHENDRAAGSAV